MASVFFSKELRKIVIVIREYNVTIPLSEIAYIKNYFDYGKEKK